MKLDTRGMDCPKPVIETKKALDNENLSQLEIIVDNEAAKINVSRFLNKKGFKDISLDEKNPKEIIIKVKISEKNEETKTVLQGQKKIFIGNDKLGSGDDKLGKLLMKGFIYSLTELDSPPKTLLFMNSGVKLCIEDSESIIDLKKLISAGTEILVCGTCLKFFEIMDKLKVGKVSNMYDISEKIMEKDSVFSLT